MSYCIVRYKCLDYRFYLINNPNVCRDCEQAENWMSNRENFLQADDVDSKEEKIEMMIKKHPVSAEKALKYLEDLGYDMEQESTPQKKSRRCLG